MHPRVPTEKVIRTKETMPDDVAAPSKPTFRDIAWSQAEAGASLSEAMIAVKIARPDLDFQQELSSNFGVEWDELLSQAKAKVKRDLRIKAIERMRLGDWKPYLSLVEHGLIEDELGAKKGEITEQKPSASLSELEAEIQRVEAELSQRQADTALNTDLKKVGGIKVEEVNL